MTLADFFEWSILGVTWTHERNLIIQVEDALTSKRGELVFHKVVYFRVLSSTVSEITSDNEIWKFEEVRESALLSDVFEKDNVYWLSQKFVGNSHVQRTFKPDELHHIVLHSDYLHFEWLCTGYDIIITDN